MWYWRGGLDVSPAGRSRVQFPVQPALSLQSCHVLPVGRLPINSFHLLSQTSQAEVNVSWGCLFIDVPGWTGCLSKLCPASPPLRAGIGSSHPAALSADQAGMNGWERDPMIFVMRAAGNCGITQASGGWLDVIECDRQNVHTFKS